MTAPASCAWCGGTSTPRSTGGHAQRFCRPICRLACDAAGRRWVAEANREPRYAANGGLCA